MDDSIKPETATRLCQDIRKAVKPRLDAWAPSHGLSPGDFEIKHLLPFVGHVCLSCHSEIDYIYHNLAGSHLAFPDGPPAIKLYGCDGEENHDPMMSIPDIWLMIWRRGPERETTTIHDHGSSAAAIKVLYGEILEVIYDVRRKDWEDKKDPLPVCGSRRRHLRTSDTTVIPVPYIHRMLDPLDGGLGLSVHAYYQPLYRQTSYLKEGNTLKPNGEWSEVGPRTCLII